MQLWFYAIFMFTTTRNGVAAKEIQRQLGVTYKCAWRMGHKIREHMALVDGDEMLEGQVEVSRTRFPWTQNWLNRSVQGGPEHDR